MSDLFLNLGGAQKLPVWQPIERIPPWRASIRGLVSDHISGVFLFSNKTVTSHSFFFKCRNCVSVRKLIDIELETDMSVVVQL
jgi:hypothetical protein